MSDIKVLTNLTDYILSNIPKADIYEQLAEECTELAQAALKKSRNLRKVNRARKSDDEVNANLIEEFTDVVNLANYILDIPVDNAMANAKNIRWCNGIRAENNSNNEES